MKIHRTERDRRKRLRDMLRAAVKSPALIFSLPCVGLCEIWSYDGFAWIFPGSGGAVRVDWYVFMRHVRKIQRRAAQ